MKKFVSIVSAASMAVSLAACSGTAENSGGAQANPGTGTAAPKNEQVTLKLGFYGEDLYLKKMNEEWIPEFEKLHPNIKVETSVDPNKIGFYQRLKTQYAADTAPDIARVIIEEFPALVSKNALLSIQSFVDRDKAELDLNDIAPALLNAFKYKNEQYAIPTDWNGSVIHYNKDLFDAAKVPYPSENWTWEDFLETAKKLTVDKNGDGKIDQYGFVVTDRLFFALPWINASGGQLLTDDMSSSVIDSPQVQSGLQFYVDLVGKHKVALHLAGAAPANLYDVFINGQVAMAAFPRSGMPNLKGKVNFDIALNPKGPEKIGGVFGVGSYAIMKKAKHPEEAWQFLKWVTSKEQQLKVTSTGSSIPSRESVTKSKEFAEYPEHANLYYEDAKYGKLIEAPPTFSEMEAAINAEMGLMFEGKKSVEDSTKYLKTKIDSVLSK